MTGDREPNRDAPDEANTHEIFEELRAVVVYVSDDFSGRVGERLSALDRHGGLGLAQVAGDLVVELMNFVSANVDDPDRSPDER